jgi:hypothetical protein
MAEDSTMPARRRFFAEVERKNSGGVYTKEMRPYNLASLLIAEPLKEEKEGGSSLKTKQPIGVGACCAGGGGGLSFRNRRDGG